MSFGCGRQMLVRTTPRFDEVWFTRVRLPRGPGPRSAQTSFGTAERPPRTGLIDRLALASRGFGRRPPQVLSAGCDHARAAAAVRDAAHREVGGLSRRVRLCPGGRACGEQRSRRL